MARVVDGSCHYMYGYGKVRECLGILLEVGRLNELTDCWV
jgi:hypothetical protein